MTSLLSPKDVPQAKIGDFIGFSDLMMHLDAFFSRAMEISSIRSLVVKPFSETNVFYLGEESQIAAAIKDIWPDLREEMKDRILMPFRDVTLVVKILAKVNEGVPYDTWVIHRFMESEDLGAGPGQGFKVFTYSVRNAGLSTLPEFFSYWYEGSKDDGYSAQMSQVFRLDLHLKKVITIDDKTMMQEAMDNAASMLRGIALISHPANYVVKVSPELTPKETRRAREGRPVPTKKPHFIVVDHDVLVGLRRGEGAGETHASPVPHQRRGHWRRLAERCKGARLLHGDRVPVRPTLVGDRTFTVGKNMYDVLLDFGKE